MKCKQNQKHMKNIKSPPVRGAWIEMTLGKRRQASITSPPVRGAWIEILFP